MDELGGGHFATAVKSRDLSTLECAVLLITTKFLFTRKGYSMGPREHITSRGRNDQVTCMNVFSRNSALSISASEGGERDVLFSQ